MVLPCFEDFDLRITEIAHQPTLSVTFCMVTLVVFLGDEELMFL